MSGGRGAQILRATWHPADHIVVLSHWRDGACASTFQLADQDVARLTSFLVDVLGQAQRSVRGS